MRQDARWKELLDRVFLPIVLTLVIGCLVPCRIFAGDNTPDVAVPQHQMRRPHNRLSLDDRINRFAKSLDLSEAQKSAVKEILEQRQQEILRIRRDLSLAGRAGIDRFRALQEKTVERIRAVLNEEQKKKYDPLAPREIPQTPQPSVEDWLNATRPH